MWFSPRLLTYHGKNGNTWGRISTQHMNEITTSGHPNLTKSWICNSEKATRGNHKAYIEAHIKFNSVIIGASRSKRIAQFMDTLSSQLRCLRGVSLATIGRQEESWKEHVQIVDALLARDAATAEALARQHVANARLAFLAQWKPGS